MVVAGRDSWLYDPFVGCDMNWYFTCGRALARGMVPYVDFIDSKGPLLWLIYGVGYVITPHSFIGVFGLECVSLIATLWIARKVAILFFGRQSLLNAIVVVLTAFALLYEPAEWRCERWCMPLLLYAIYGALSIMMSGEPGRSNGVMFKTGLCIGLALMIKYSIAAMIAAVALLQLYATFGQRRQSLWPSLWRLVLGAVVAMAPFVIYLLCVGAFVPFVREYCVHTLLTVENIGDLRYRDLGPLQRMYAHYVLFFLWNVIAQGLSALLFLWVFKAERYRWVAVYCVAVCAAVYSMGYYYYYAEAGNACLVLGIVALLTLIQRCVHARWAYAAMLALAVVVCFAHGAYFFSQCSYAFNKRSYKRTIFHTALDIVARQGRYCKIMYYLTMPVRGELGLRAEALPACPDWAQQNGNYVRTRCTQRSAIAQHEPDVIVVNRKMGGDGYCAAKRYLDACGYHAVAFATAADSAMWQRGDQEIFLRRPMTAHIVDASDADVLLRRR